MQIHFFWRYFYLWKKVKGWWSCLAKKKKVTDYNCFFTSCDSSVRHWIYSSLLQRWSAVHQCCTACITLCIFMIYRKSHGCRHKIIKSLMRRLENYWVPGHIVTEVSVLTRYACCQHGLEFTEYRYWIQFFATIHVLSN